MDFATPVYEVIKHELDNDYDKLKICILVPTTAVPPRHLEYDGKVYEYFTRGKATDRFQEGYYLVKG